jgi:restriction system protein
MKRSSCRPRWASGREARRATSSLTTTARFSGDGAPAIDLLDGEALCDLLKELRIGVEVKQVEEIILDEAAFRDL